MKSKLLLILSLCTGFTFAQDSPLSIHANYLYNLSFTPFDSIAVFTDTTASASTKSQAHYLLLNQAYILGGKKLSATDSLAYLTEISPREIKVFETRLPSGDTLQCFIFNQNQNGRDISMDVITYEFGQVPAPISNTEYYYNANNQLDSTYQRTYMPPGSFLASSSAKFYYSHHGIDSILIPNPSGSGISSKTVFEYDANGTLIHQDHFTEINGSFDVYSRYQYFHDQNADITENHVYYSDFSTGNLELYQVVKYLKSRSFSIDEISGSSFSVFPNPASGYLNVKHPSGDETIAFQIFSLNANLVKKAITTQGINLEGLKPGLYVLKLTSGEQTGSLKFLVK